MPRKTLNGHINEHRDVKSKTYDRSIALNRVDVLKIANNLRIIKKYGLGGHVILLY